MSRAANRETILASGPRRSTAGDATPAVTVGLSIRVITAALLIPVGLFVALGALYAVLDGTGRLDADISILGQFSLGEEYNLAAWYSSLLLFAASVLLALNAAAERARGRPLRDWILLSVVFLWLSCDETIQIHERAGLLSPGFGNISPLFYHPWVGIALICLAILGLYLLPFLFRLPKVTRLRFIVAGLVYVGSAVGFEMLEGLAASGGRWTVVSFLIVVEEFGEMLGAVLFIRALLYHLGAARFCVEPIHRRAQDAATAQSANAATPAA